MNRVARSIASRRCRRMPSLAMATSTKVNLEFSLDLRGRNLSNGRTPGQVHERFTKEGPVSRFVRVRKGRRSFGKGRLGSNRKGNRDANKGLDGDLDGVIAILGPSIATFEGRRATQRSRRVPSANRAFAAHHGRDVAVEGGLAVFLVGGKRTSGVQGGGNGLERWRNGFGRVSCGCGSALDETDAFQRVRDAADHAVLG